MNAVPQGMKRGIGLLLLLSIGLMPTTLQALQSPVLEVEPAQLAFETAEGSSPAPQLLTIRNGGSEPCNWQSDSDAPWLIAASSGSLPGGQSTEIQVIVLSDTLEAGEHRTQITVSSPEASNSPVAVPVTLHVEREPEPVTPGVLNVSPLRVAFEAEENGMPNPRSITIRNDGGSPFGWTAQSSMNWIQLRPTAGTLDPQGSTQVSVSVVAAQMDAGTYSGSIVVSSPSASGSPQLIDVTLQIQPSTPRCGDVIYSDDFSDSTSGWNIDAGSGFDWAYTNDGQYRVFITASGYVAWSWAPLSQNRIPNDFCLEVDVKLHVTGSLSTHGQLGFIFAGNNAKQTFTQMGIIPDLGRYQIRAHDPEWREIIPWTESSAIESVNEVNRLRMIAHDGKATFYINDVEVKTVTVATGGAVGVFTGSFDEPNVNGRFDNFTIRELR